MPKKKLAKRADGRYVKTIVDRRTGKRHYIYGFSEREVYTKMLEFSEEQDHGRLFSVVLDEWYNDAAERMTYNTFHGYQACYKRVRAAFGDRHIKDITSRDIQAFLRTFASRGLSAKLIMTHKTIIKCAFDIAVEQGDVSANPATAIAMPKGKPPKEREAATTAEEQIIMRDTDGWLFPFLALMTGCRRGEILGLRWEDIDFDKSRIQIRRSVFYPSGGAQTKAPKTEKSVRFVPLLQPLRDRLYPIRQKEGFILSDDGGKTALSYRRFQTLFGKYKEKTGITATAHQLRHSFATIAFESGVPAKSIQEILGHRYLSTTMDIYTDFREQAFTVAADTLNEAIKNRVDKEDKT